MNSKFSNDTDESLDPSAERSAQSIPEPRPTGPFIKITSDKETDTQAFNRLVLCNEKKPYVQVFVSAGLSEGCLQISGQDLGQAPAETFGEDEYEYFYNFDRENTERLFTLLTPEKQDIAKVLVREFSGMDGCSKLREFCEANRIKYSFFTC